MWVRPAGAPRRADRRWYEKKRYILPLGLLVSAVLGTTAGGLRDEASSQPSETVWAAALPASVASSPDLAG